VGSLGLEVIELLRTAGFCAPGWKQRARADVPGLLDKRQVAETLGVSVRYVDGLLARRELPFVRLGRLVRFQPEAVDAYVAAHVEPARRGVLSA